MKQINEDSRYSGLVTPEMRLNEHKKRLDSLEEEIQSHRRLVMAARDVLRSFRWLMKEIDPFFKE